jgi:hypothetical protein
MITFLVCQIKSPAKVPVILSKCRWLEVNPNLKKLLAATKDAKEINSYQTEDEGWDVSKCAIGSDDDSMTDDEINTIIDIVTNGEGLNKTWPLVGLFTVVAHRIEDAPID